MYLLLFLIYYISFGPFCHRFVAIDFVLGLCCFVRGLLTNLLVVVYNLYLFLRI
jgi:hypothetical protein